MKSFPPGFTADHEVWFERSASGEWVQFKDYESLESRAQQAKQALRELVTAEAYDNKDYDDDYFVRLDAAWAAARAIVEQATG